MNANRTYGLKRRISDKSGKGKSLPSRYQVSGETWTRIALFFVNSFELRGRVDPVNVRLAQNRVASHGCFINQFFRSWIARSYLQSYLVALNGSKYRARTHRCESGSLTILFLVGTMGCLACLRVRTVSGADWEAEKYRGMLCALLLNA